MKELLLILAAIIKNARKNMKNRCFKKLSIFWKDILLKQRVQLFG
jgi:hypothetical protein